MNKIDFKVNQQWIKNDRCPCCQSSSIKTQGLLPGNSYTFYNKPIIFPREGIAVMVCSECGIFYKNIIPSPNFLSEVFVQSLGKSWESPYDFSSEVKMLEELVNNKSFDLLDVGASNGELLKSCPNVKGRRSALDVVKHPEIEAKIHGEFIQGFLEDRDLNWSNQPYDIVTLFDVLEHLYRPDIAFKNLIKLVKKEGFVIIETGDAKSQLAQHFGTHNWWYAKLFEHHVFWSEFSLGKIANKYGFDVIQSFNKRHKRSVNVSLISQIKALPKLSLYYMSPKSYYSLLSTLSKPSIQPRHPAAKDHLRVVLQKR